MLQKRKIRENAEECRRRGVMAVAKRKLKKGAVAFLAALVVLLAVGIGALVTLLPGTANLSEPVTVVIDEGMGTKAVARRLADAGVVKNVTSFAMYTKNQKAAGDLRPGTYTFEGKVTYADVLAQLKNGRGNDNTVNVTIPEGKTVPQVAAIWADAGLCTADEFLAACAELDVPYDYIPDGDDYNRLEGFLFPETYNVLTTWGAEELVNLQLAQFDKIWTDERRQQAADLGYSAKEIVTVASLIEREARVASERPLIASVIYNRLAIGQALQIDATIQYILGEQVERVTYDDLKIESPYNTYLNAGLPPGAICSPGLSCIDAALSPADTEYYYYRTKNDGSGEHNFAKTYAEHLANGKS
jgi:UPF0755 protein